MADYGNTNPLLRASRKECQRARAGIGIVYPFAIDNPLQFGPWSIAVGQAPEIGAHGRLQLRRGRWNESSFDSAPVEQFIVTDDCIIKIDANMQSSPPLFNWRRSAGSNTPRRSDRRMSDRRIPISRAPVPSSAGCCDKAGSSRDSAVGRPCGRQRCSIQRPQCCVSA